MRFTQRIVRISVSLFFPTLSAPVLMLLKYNVHKCVIFKLLIFRTFKNSYKSEKLPCACTPSRKQKIPRCARANTTSYYTFIPARAHN